MLIFLSEVFYLEIILETLSDNWIMLPLLYITYCVIEHFERKPESDDKMFFSLQKYGPLFGAVLGLIPQCGFSILAAMLFIQNNISLGTLVAVFIATSDEAIPVLISNPNMYLTLGKLLVLKFIIAILVGYIVDKLIYPKQKILLFSDMEDEDSDEENEEEISDNSCPCCYVDLPLWRSALYRSLKIFSFVIIASLILNTLIYFIGEEKLGVLLLNNSIIQPIIASILGFIPNCAITVVFATLYVVGDLQFGSLLAGLITNAGMGLLCLIQYGANKKDTYKVISILLISAIISGIVFYFI